jgi:hypothetical protein
VREAIISHIGANKECDGLVSIDIFDVEDADDGIITRCAGSPTEARQIVRQLGIREVTDLTSPWGFV